MGPEFAMGRMDAIARSPRRLASKEYGDGYLDGLNVRASTANEETEFSGVTVHGAKMRVSARGDGTFEWAVKDSMETMSAMGTAPDMESGIAACEGALRRRGSSVARRDEIVRTLGHLKPGMDAAEIERLANRVVDRIVSKGG
jgi:hypothetical protein